MNTLVSAIILSLGATALGALGQGGPPPMRKHTATTSKPLTLVPADQHPPAESKQTIITMGAMRKITANAIPSHLVGRFPNAGNPHVIQEQTYQFEVPLHPTPAATITSLYGAGKNGPPNIPFGVAVNGVLMEPGTAEFWNGDRQADWNYEALGGAVPLGIDANMAHVQPNGSYHYHGLPKGLLNQLGLRATTHSPLVGWAADGFPIYALYGYADPKDPASEVVELTSGFRLKSGTRPLPPTGPGGAYDGTFFKDYEFADEKGSLDECNGRFSVTPEFPDGTYAYFLTTQWPVIPRALKGTPTILRSPRTGPPGNGGRPNQQNGRLPPPPPGRFK